MRRLNVVEAEDRMRWLGGDHWSAVYGGGPGAKGYDPDEGWDAAVWVLHAMYEWPDLAPGLSHHELHQQAIDNEHDVLDLEVRGVAQARFRGAFAESTSHSEAFLDALFTSTSRRRVAVGDQQVGTR
jgi:hypothetical protein